MGTHIEEFAMNIMNFVTRDVIAVAPSDSIDKAMSLMEEFHIHHLVVKADDHVVGMLSDRDLLLSVGWALSSDRRLHTSARSTVIGPTTVDQVMARNVIAIHNSDTGQTAAKVMVDRKVGALPVFSGGHLVGIVTESDLMFWLDKLGNGSDGQRKFVDQPIGTLMRASVMTVKPNDPIGEIVDIFRRRRIRHVPVVESGGRLCGIVSDRDVRRGLGQATIRDMQEQESGGMYLGPRVASDIMTPVVHTIGVNSPVRQALALMLDHRVHSLPVIEGDTIVGIVTQTDFVKAIARDALL